MYSAEPHFYFENENIWHNVAVREENNHGVMVAINNKAENFHS